MNHLHQLLILLGLISTLEVRAESSEESDQVAEFLYQVFGGKFEIINQETEAFRTAMKVEVKDLKEGEEKTIIKVFCAEMGDWKDCRTYRFKVRRVPCPRQGAEQVCYEYLDWEVRCGLLSWCPEEDPPIRAVWIDRTSGMICRISDDEFQTGKPDHCFRISCVRTRADGSSDVCSAIGCLDGTQSKVECEVVGPVSQN